MNFPTMRAFYPDDFIAALKALGPYDWMRFYNNPSRREVGFDLHIPSDPNLGSHKKIIEFFEHLWSGGDLQHLLHFFAISKLLASGPKLLSPTVEQCQALENVEVALSLAEYEQPFPAILVELPTEYCQSLRLQHGVDAARFVLVFHHRDSQCLYVAPQKKFSEVSTYCIISACRHRTSIEDALRNKEEEDGADLRVSEAIIRVAINFALLLTRYGVRECGPVNAKAVERQQRNTARSNTRKAERAKRLLNSTIYRIEFAQEVVFYNRERNSQGTTANGSRMMPPHWRRGHFRRVAHGSGRRGRRLVFIPPVLINSDCFRGDLANTAYSARSPKLLGVEGIPRKPR